MDMEGGKQDGEGREEGGKRDVPYPSQHFHSHTLPSTPNLVRASTHTADPTCMYLTFGVDGYEAVFGQRGRKAAAGGEEAGGHHVGALDGVSGCAVRAKRSGHGGAMGRITRHYIAGRADRSREEQSRSECK
jgi:hypothetical protein